jgi:hypothetical protein
VELEIAAWQPAVQGLIDALGQRVDPRELGALRAALRRTYAAQRLFDRAATGLADDWDPDAARVQFAFLDSRLGRRVLQAQATRRDAAAVDRYRSWSASFAQSEVPAGRLELVRRLDRALLTSQSAVLVNRAVLDGALASFTGALSGAESAAFGDLRARAPAEGERALPARRRRGCCAGTCTCSNSALRRGARALRGVRGVGRDSGTWSPPRARCGWPRTAPRKICSRRCARRAALSGATSAVTEIAMAGERDLDHVADRDVLEAFGIAH